ncbi:Piso0_000359 [Millerozyma farinosa CBS 7064]|uniref:Piso0_000359 protein n=1 Tax=Pichia sorbitophila (strain ATCC MYA-4447 / BCRC 22081 / CBS 7064 / NBRC 10061 / NRRL Y-12695) TaxID=559304 RepID=G8YTS5_PICSO|nr:Piso0_000359 [Millerozyma farinosa CBS 7064]CCE73326.1 Piso0_000359 [Millerozyma farinosa CBS 7064]
MTELAFNNYCIACDKFCGQNSIYCSEQCRMVDEKQSMHMLESSTAAGGTQMNELVSPIIAPVAYQHYDHYTAGRDGQQPEAPSSDLVTSPLVLAAPGHPIPDFERQSFDLNYSMNMGNATASVSKESSQTIIDHIPSTSHNYRKWLTACL